MKRGCLQKLPPLDTVNQLPLDHSKLKGGDLKKEKLHSQTVPDEAEGIHLIADSMNKCLLAKALLIISWGVGGKHHLFQF